MRPWLHVVIRRVREERLHVVGVVGGAVVVHPGPADRELVEPEHVEDAHVGESGPEELRVLDQASADEETPVRAPRNGELLR